MKYLFEMPPRDLSRKPYAAGLTPEADAWAKANLAHDTEGGKKIECLWMNYNPQLTLF